MYDGIIAAPACSAWSAHAADQTDDRPLQQPDTTTQIESQVERDLLIARAARVKPPPGIADTVHQLTLDEAVHVFVGTRDPRWVATPLLEDLAQRLDDGRGIGGGQHPCGG